MHLEHVVWGPGRRYKRHSVETDVRRFCGWSTLLRWLGYAKNDDERVLLAFTFETGAQISEVLALSAGMFHVNRTLDPRSPIVVVSGIPLAKQYRKIEGSEYLECSSCHLISPRGTLMCPCEKNLLITGRRRWKTEKLREVRLDFPIMSTEPLVRKVHARKRVERKYKK
jgi:hypothetical protein